MSRAGATSYRERVGAEVREAVLPEIESTIDDMLEDNRTRPGSWSARWDADRCFRNLRKILRERSLVWWADQAHRGAREIMRRELDRIKPYYT